jgi:hypothetical protein
MQTHPLSLTAAAPATSINIEGRAFRYISGTSAGDARIIVKPESGNEMELKPGQGFKLTGEVGRWFVKSFDGVSNITGTLNIGSGDFEDNNVRLDGSVAIAGTPTVNLSAGTKVQEELIAYNGAWTDNANLAAWTAVQIVAPGANVNGITVHAAMIEDRLTGETGAFLAKAGAAPVDFVTGDVIVYAKGKPSATEMSRLTNKIKVPAGKGLYYIQNHANGTLRTITYTIH